MSASRIFSVAAVAAFASFAAHADSYGAHFQDEVQSTRTRAEVHAEAVKAAPNFKNFAVVKESAPSTLTRAAVRSEAETAARAGAIAVGNRG